MNEKSACPTDCAQKVKPFTCTKDGGPKDGENQSQRSDFDCDEWQSQCALTIMRPYGKVACKALLTCAGKVKSSSTFIVINVLRHQVYMKQKCELKRDNDIKLNVAKDILSSFNCVLPFLA